MIKQRRQRDTKIMARTQRAAPNDIYAAHAAEARQLMDAATTDDARTALDHAAVAHETAARLVLHANTCARRANRLRQDSVEMRGRQNPGAADHIAADAAEYEAAALSCRTEAERWHQEGHRRAAEATTIPDAADVSEEMMQSAPLTPPPRRGRSNGDSEVLSDDSSTARN